MKISLVSAAATARKLSALIRKHDSISIAVAWGGITEVAQTLLAHSEKFESVLLGVDFSATEAALVDCLVDVPNAYVAQNRPGCRSEEHTSDLQSLMRSSYAVSCLKKQTHTGITSLNLCLHALATLLSRRYEQ